MLDRAANNVYNEWDNIMQANKIASMVAQVVFVKLVSGWVVDRVLDGSARKWATCSCLRKGDDNPDDIVVEKEEEEVKTPKEGVKKGAPFNPEKFRTQKRTEPVSSFWGNNHSPESDPVSQGWRVRQIADSPEVWGVFNIHKPGIMGLTIEEGQCSILVLPNRSKKDLKTLIKGEVRNGEVHRRSPFNLHPGSGLEAIKMMENLFYD